MIMLLLDVKVIPIYMSIMILITLDRFFTFFLNLKYDRYWLKTESRIFLVFLYTVALLIFTPALICALESIFYDGNTFKHIITDHMIHMHKLHQCHYHGPHGTLFSRFTLVLFLQDQSSGADHCWQAAPIVQKPRDWKDFDHSQGYFKFLKTFS